MCIYICIHTYISLYIFIHMHICITITISRCTFQNTYDAKQAMFWVLYPTAKAVIVRNIPLAQTLSQAGPFGRFMPPLFGPNVIWAGGVHFVEWSTSCIKKYTIAHSWLLCTSIVFDSSSRVCAILVIWRLDLTIDPNADSIPTGPTVQTCLKLVACAIGWAHPRATSSKLIIQAPSVSSQKGPQG